MVDLLTPTPPKDKPFDTLVKIFKDHSEVKPVAVQAANDSVADYRIMSLSFWDWQLSVILCEYGAFLREAIQYQ